MIQWAAIIYLIMRVNELERVSKLLEAQSQQIKQA